MVDIALFLNWLPVNSTEVDIELFLTLAASIWHVVKHGVESGVTFGVNFGVFFFNSFQKCILFHLQK